MKVLRLCGTTLARACIWFTVLILALYTGGMIVSGIEREWIPTMKMVWMVLVFAIAFEASNQIVLKAPLAAPLRLAIHYAVTLFVFFVVFIVWGGYTERPSSVLVILIVFTLLYAAGALVFFGIRSLLRNARNRTETYDPRFSGKRNG